jgi:glycosyltransferase involved in cell wall biosynthesis
MAAQKHILFISSWYPSAADPTLGIFNRYFALAAAEFNKVSVLQVSSEPELTSQFKLHAESEQNIAAYFVNYKKVNARIPFLSSLWRRHKVIQAFELGFQKLMKEQGKPDLIHLNVALPMGLAVLHLSKKYKIPFVLNENWSGYCAEDGNYKGFIPTYFTKQIVAQARCIMPTSTYLRDAMLSHGLEGNYKVIPNVVNVDVFKPLPNPAHKGIQLIHISSLNDREKNVSGLIRAFAEAKKQKSDLRLQIVGEGPDKLKYLELVRALHLESDVSFLGRLFSAALVEAINASDALIMFSHFETFCLVNIEAFACGKPVITSDAGAIKTYMNDDLGVMVKKGDEAALTKGILEFCEHQSQFNANEIRDYAVKNYSYQKVGKDLDEIYTLALKN